MIVGYDRVPELAQDLLSCVQHEASPKRRSSGQAGHNATGVMAQALQVETGDLSVFDNDPPADEQITDVCRPAARDRSRENIVHSEVARAGKIEHRDIG